MRQPRPALRLTSLAAASGLLFAGAAAHAQATAPAAAASAPQAQQLETVVVTGIRKSLETSVNLKRSASGLVDGIVAEDIGKFPDTNLAEAMSRISGVSIDRSNGEGTKVTVRGMGPDFNLVLLNGRQMPGSNVDGTAPSSRSFDFSNLAAEGVAALEVYKTSKASTPTGGMGATINIRTPRPFDSKETIASVGVKMVHDTTARNLPAEEQGKSLTPELSGIYSTQFADGMFGIALIGSYQERDSGYNASAANNGWHTFKGSDSGWGPLPNPAPEVKNRPQAGDIYNVPQSLNYAFTGIHRERTNGQLVFQFRPVKDLVGTLDYTMSEQKFRQKRNDISAWFNFGGQFGEYTPGPIATPLVYGEHMSGQDVAMGTSRTSTSNKNRSLGLNLKWKATDALSFELDAHHSTATSGADDPLGTSVTLGTASFNRGDTSVDFSNKFPVLSIANAPLDPSLQELQGSVFGNSYQRNEINQAQTHGKWKIDGDSSLDFGISLTDVKNRSAYTNVQRNTWGHNAGSPGGPADMPDNIWHADSISKYFSNVPGHDSTKLYNQFFYFNFDDVRNAAIKALGTNLPYLASFDFDNSQNYAAKLAGLPNVGYDFKDYRTTEKSRSLYLQYNRSWDWGVPMDASVGARYESTRVTSPTNQSIPATVEWASTNELSIKSGGASTSFVGTGKYSYVLPSIDLSADVMPDTKLRLSYGETIGRPGWADIQGSINLNNPARIDGNVGSSGNPNLKPLHSKNFDFSAEHYYAKGSYISAAYFRKDLTNYIEDVAVSATPFNLHTPVGSAMYNEALSKGGCGATDSACVRNYIFTNYPNAAGVNVGTQTIVGQPGDPLLVFKMASKANSSRKASLNGIELNAQHSFANGLGFSANYTHVKSAAAYQDGIPGSQFAIDGLGDSGNLVGFYEDTTYSARLAYNWRGKYLLQHFPGTDGAQPLYVEQRGQLDMSLGYNFDKHLSLQLEGINLTDAIVRTHMRAEQQIGSVTQLGRRYMIGARYKF
ncbi:TonB-dependent receptor [Roseateles saccharophilus]|uniref:TonB-dependent receptor n=1 Tax=Roseateles saccharophilus TaxID=304 RepID=A0A4R3UV47_ROSSA|nr:TonB-dependent receptor [Roseateles saccharophilus]MDG0833213.1 TonB-dependent receptor [Roseateles saccharophilus]TCU94438.1 TonB-dependent receptor [Roseateles saccharophilus]